MTDRKPDLWLENKDDQPLKAGEEHRQTVNCTSSKFSTLQPKYAILTGHQSPQDAEFEPRNLDKREEKSQTGWKTTPRHCILSESHHEADSGLTKKHGRLCNWSSNTHSAKPRLESWQTARQPNSLTSIQHSVYASQTVKNTMAGEERERQKINTSRDTHCLLSFLLTNTTTYTYECDGTVHVEAYTQHEQQKHETEANNTKHRTWYFIPLYYGFKLQSSCRLPLICSRFVL